MKKPVFSDNNIACTVGYDTGLNEGGGRQQEIVTLLAARDEASRPLASGHLSVLSRSIERTNTVRIHGRYDSAQQDTR